MKNIRLDKWDPKRTVLIMIVLTTVDRGRCIRRQSHVQSNKQTYLELACDTFGINYSTEYFYMDNPSHGHMYHLQDSLVPTHNYTGKANDTLPPGFLIDKSSIEYSGLGVFTLKHLPLLTMIGPYGGIIVPKANQNESTLVYAWEIEQDAVYHHLVDAQDETRSNWLRYINSPNTEEGANMKAYQSKGHMMYKTLKHIPPCTELLVWYGDNYGKYLDELREEREAGYEEEDNKENDSEVNGFECDTDYENKDNLIDIGEEDTNSYYGDSGDIDKNNGNENTIEKSAFVTDTDETDANRCNEN